MIESYLRAFERTATPDKASAPDWARSLRLSAITRFETLGFPTTKNEDWHFTSVAPIAEREFDLLAPPKHGVRAAQLAPFRRFARSTSSSIRAKSSALSATTRPASRR